MLYIDHISMHMLVFVSTGSGDVDVIASVYVPAALSPVVALDRV